MFTALLGDSQSRLPLIPRPITSETKATNRTPFKPTFPLQMLFQFIERSSISSSPPPHISFSGQKAHLLSTFLHPHPSYYGSSLATYRQYQSSVWPLEYRFHSSH